MPRQKKSSIRALITMLGFYDLSKLMIIHINLYDYLEIRG
jgi:hypothetical protein